MRLRTLFMTCSRHASFGVLVWALWCISLAGVAYPYAQKPDAQKVEQALKRVQRWQFNERSLQRSDLRLLAQAGATQAIPFLKEEFRITKETSLKLAIASALVELGEKARVYWAFLAEEANVAVENDAPSIFSLDSEGKVDRSKRELPPEFIEWAKAHKLDPAAAAARAQALELPVKFLYLAVTGDPRGRDLLRLGLKSRNFSIRSYAAQGLAKLRDNDSIPLIIEAGRTMPRGGALFIAAALLFFDEPRAQSAAEMFISNKQVLEELRNRIRAGTDPFLL